MATVYLRLNSREIACGHVNLAIGLLNRDSLNRDRAVATELLVVCFWKICAGVKFGIHL